MQSNRVTDAFERKVANVFDTFISKNEPMIIASSGGPDSTALLIATAKVRKQGSVIAANFNHRLRPHDETEADSAFVLGLSNDLGCRFLSGMSKSFDKNDELSARTARYEW